MKLDQFSMPYSRRPCPAGTPPAVWQAFVHWAEPRIDAAETARRWLAYLDVHRLYYDENYQLRPEPLQPNLFA